MILELSSFPHLPVRLLSRDECHEVFSQEMLHIHVGDSFTDGHHARVKSQAGLLMFYTISTHPTLFRLLQQLKVFTTSAKS